MRGRTARTPELVAEVQRLRARGMQWKDIAAATGLPRSTVHSWVADPDGAKLSARKASYAGKCVDCGAPTHGGEGPSQPSKRCVSCFQTYRRENFGVWDRERIVAAIRAWADENGGVPPSGVDWNPPQARAIGHPEKAERFERDQAWPWVNTVQRYFGSWNAAIEAAGFEPRRTGCYGREGEDPAVVAETVRLYRSGLSGRQIAAALGISPNAVYGRLEKAGVPRRARRNQAA